MTSTIESVASFDRYVPRIATNWEVDAPDRKWQELDATLPEVGEYPPLPGVEASRPWPGIHQHPPITWRAQ